eukprot:TRINITY_DN10299_c0_g3_i1.p1 TRINITY_DN10299_c0_g3~~TRINITY_DN10299_c0_g3_i1.p1  ORF type:complete len:275 (+),score=28.87 TRINITY_DN10299_c0_g3_i1:24-827(+)
MIRRPPRSTHCISSAASDVYKRQFLGILKRPGNFHCADCKSQAPRWASTSFGVLVCISCSGFHRRFGSHITKVRSLDLDNWTRDTLNLYTTLDNATANEYWECTLPSNCTRPSQYTSDTAAWKFMQDKYINQLFAPKHKLDPVASHYRKKDLAIKADIQAEVGSKESAQWERRLRKSSTPKVRKALGDDVEEAGAKCKASCLDALEEIPDERGHHERIARMVIFKTGTNAFTYARNEAKVKKHCSLNVSNARKGIHKELFKSKKHFV